MKIDLLIIDAQNDFLDNPKRMGSLPVIGGYQDMQRLAAFIRRVGPKLNDIHATMDTHRLLDVAHPAWWRGVDHSKAGGVNMKLMPTPGTQIMPDEIGPDKKWMPVIPQYLSRMQSYVKELKAQGKYDHTIWPPHCLIGTWGNNIEENVARALLEWEEQNVATVDYVTKGSNSFTEHFSALKAEVVDPKDPSTALNRRLIDILEDCDRVYIAGEALSHCVKSSVEDIADNFGNDSIKKLCLLTDCSSPVIVKDAQGKTVIDFTDPANQFVAAMQARGMRVETSLTALQ